MTLPPDIIKAFDDRALASSILNQADNTIRKFYREQGSVPIQYDGQHVEERRSKYLIHDLHLLLAGIKATSDAADEWIGNVLSSISPSAINKLFYLAPEDIREPVFTWMELNDPEGDCGMKEVYGDWSYGIRKSVADGDKSEVKMPDDN